MEPRIDIDVGNSGTSDTEILKVYIGTFTIKSSRGNNNRPSKATTRRQCGEDHIELPVD
jgi:hypothetical protein